MHNKNSEHLAQLRNRYDETWKTLTEGRPSLADLADFGNIAREYAKTSEGERRLYDDLAKSSGTICTILEDIVSQLGEKDEKDSGEERVTPRGYLLSSHIIEQAEAKGFSVEQLVDVIDNPNTAYESRRYPGQMKHVRDGLCVAVDPASKKAITVFVDLEFTDRREDQTDADALEYERKRRAAES